MIYLDNTSQIKTFTFSALADILSDSFAICRTSEFPECGNYYYNEIKTAKWENQPIKVLQNSLDVIDDKIDGLTDLSKKKLITRALIDFTHRNIPSSDAEMLCNNMRWIIVE